MNPKAKGEISQGIILAHFLKQGKTVLIPFGDNQRYDLVIEEEGVFVRVQCKTGRLRDGVIRFAACSSALHRGGTKKSYVGDVELFMVYCPDNEKIYRMPVTD